MFAQSTTVTPSFVSLALNMTAPSGDSLTSTGFPPTLSSPVISMLSRSIRTRNPENSVLATMVFPSGVNSAWFTPAWGMCSILMSVQLFGSWKSTELSRSAMTMAFAPSGEKYRL